MRTRLAGTLALVIALTGIAWGPAPQSIIASLTHGQADAAPGARRLADAGGGLIRKGPFVNQLSSPTITVQVLGTYDIFLAGRTYPFNVRGRFGLDLAGRHAPADLPVNVAQGTVVTITTAHGTANGPSSPLAKDANGNTHQIIMAGPAEKGATKVGLSSIKAPVDGLVGVFTSSKPNNGRAPSALNFNSPKARDATTVRPGLNQVFFIGKGVTSKGIKKHFLVPAGATHLYLGSLDFTGSNHDNHGVILAFVTGTETISNLFILAPVSTPVAVTTSITTPVVLATQFAGTVFPTDTATNTPMPTNTPQPTGTFTVQLVNGGTPVNVNASGTAVNDQGTPIVVTNSQGTPITVSGGNGGSGGGGGGSGGSGGGGSGGGSGGGGGGGSAPSATTIPSNTPINTASNTPTTTATGTPTVTSTGTATSTPTVTPTFTPIPVQQNWDQFQYQFDHNGYNPQETTINNNPNSPTFAGYMRLIWESQQQGVPANGGPVLDAGRLYYTGGSNLAPASKNAIYCVTANTGDQCSGAFNRRVVGSGAHQEDTVPAVAGGIVYFLSHNGGPGGTGSLVAYDDNNSGALVLNTGTAVNLFSGNPVEDLPTNVGSTVAVFNGTCYVATNTGHLHFIDCGPFSTTRGQDLLHFGGFPGVDFAALANPATAGPAVDPSFNQVIINEADGYTQAFYDQDDISGPPGTVHWTQHRPGAGSGFTPVVANGRVFAAFTGGVFAYAADSPTGTLLWSSGIGASNAPAFNPQTGINTLYVPSGTGLHYVNPDTGTDRIPVVGFTSPIVSGPITVNNVVFVGLQDGRVIALDAISGALLNPNPNPTVTPVPTITGYRGSGTVPGAALVAANGHLFFPSVNGSIFNYSF